MYDREERLNKGVKVLAFIALIALVLGLARGCAHAETGTASWYSYESCRKEGTNGKITASGERFDHNALTCASWDYAFGTILKVSNTRNHKATYVKVSDRGPSKRLYRRGRIVDLSKGAFARIASLKEGVIPVKVEVVSYAKAEGR